MLPPPRGNGEGNPNSNPKPGPKQPGAPGEKAQQAAAEAAAADAIRQAVQEQERAMAEAREAGLAPGQLPPPGAGEGTGAAPTPPGFNAMALPNLDGIKVDELMENWAKLKPKERQQVIERMREKWPERYRKSIEAYLAVVGEKQSGQPVVPAPGGRK